MYSVRPIPKRRLLNVGQEIWRAVSVIEDVFGGVLTHDSNHKVDKASTWVFTFPKHRNAQIAVAMNVKKVSLLMCSRTLAGKELSEKVKLLAKVEETYVDENEGVSSAVLGYHAPYLNPSLKNPLLRIAPPSGDIEGLLRIYLDAPEGSSSPETTLLELNKEAVDFVTPTRKRAVTAAELYAKLDRQAEIGVKGEEISMAFEMARLRALGCPNPETWVKLVALTDVARGYDIESTYLGHERCIEVKSATRAESDFFLTENECSVLEELGEKAWIYRVVVSTTEGSKVVAQIQNPMKLLNASVLQPVVFKVSGKVLLEAD